MYIVKSSGQREKFDPEKLRQTLRRAGTSSSVVDRVVNAVSERVREGTATARIMALLQEQLKRESQAAFYRYNLRDALLKLGPAGFKFEKYVASILEAYGWRTELPEELQGECVRHEVDIIARKGNRTVMIEAKFRNQYSHFVRLKDVMATWTRFQDLESGAAMKLCPKFDEVWIITNGKISTRSQKFGSCKGIRLFGWNFPREQGLASLVDHTALYPVTAIHDLKPFELDRLFGRGIMLCRQVASQTPKRLAQRLGLSARRSEDLVRICTQIMKPEDGHESHTHPVFG